MHAAFFDPIWILFTSCGFALREHDELAMGMQLCEAIATCSIMGLNGVEISATFSALSIGTQYSSRWYLQPRKVQPEIQRHRSNI